MHLVLRNYTIVLHILLTLVISNALAEIVPLEEACPTQQDSVIDGHACNYQATPLEYMAYPIAQSADTSDFRKGTPLVLAHRLNDHHVVTGMAYSNSGVKQAVKVTINTFDPTTQQFKRLGHPGSESTAHAVDSEGLVVGTSTTLEFPSIKTPVLWDCGNLQPLPLLAPQIPGVAVDVAADAAGITHAVGYAYDATHQSTFGFVRAIKNSLVSQPAILLDDFPNWPTALNSALTIVGTAIDNNYSRAFWCQYSDYCDFLDRESIYSVANAINNNAVPKIVGTSLDPITFRFTATLWHKGTIVSLNSLSEGMASYANAISDGGDIVGQSGLHATLWRDNIPYNLNLLTINHTGELFAYALDINRHGEILVATANRSYYLLVPN